MPRTSDAPDRGRRGNAAYAALTIVTLLGFAALTIDAGHARSVQFELQNAADAAAQAGASQIDGTSAGLSSARDMAGWLAAANTADGQAVSLSSSDVVTGRYDGGTFTASTDPAQVNALRVTAQVPSMRTFFAAAAFGRTTMGAAASATSLTGGDFEATEVPCYIPLAIPACELDRSSTALQSATFALNPAGVDSTGWGMVGAHPNAASLRALISACFPTSGSPTYSSATKASTDDASTNTVGLMNGVASSVVTDLASAVAGSSTTWNTSVYGAMPTYPGSSSSSIPSSKWGRVIEAPILVFDSGETSCSSGTTSSFNTAEPIVGFVWGALYDVYDHGAHTTISMKLDVSNLHEFGTAGSTTKTTTGVAYKSTPRFVK